jgi:tetratricopeptide (TPR) repeat protein
VRFLTITLFIAIVAPAGAQFVYPSANDHDPEPGLYKEDPFIVEFRQKFFAVFKGDFATFNQAFDEVTEMVRKNPNDARALVWLGNGQTVKAGLLSGKGKIAEGLALLETSRKNLDRAVALHPRDPNIYMMRAATLYIQGQFWKPEQLPKVVWQRLRDDCHRFIDFLGDRLPRVSTHVRGETYGELGIAEKNLGNLPAAKVAFQKVIDLCPGTKYEARAKKELALLAKS